jgi:hypothetical protein
MVPSKWCLKKAKELTIFKTTPIERRLLKERY